MISANFVLTCMDQLIAKYKQINCQICTISNLSLTHDRIKTKTKISIYLANKWHYENNVIPRNAWSEFLQERATQKYCSKKQ